MTDSTWASVFVTLVFLCKAVVCVPPTFVHVNPLQVPENTTAGTTIGVLTVIDATLSHISITVSTTSLQYVYLDQETSINGFYNASIVLARQLDYETDGSSLKLLFTAINPSTPDGVRQNVTVIIKDVNDVHPQFHGLPYSVAVPENENINTVLFTANSTDPDTGTGGLVTYTMKTSHPDYETMFDVSNTGKVTLIGHLDYETFSFYQFTIVATDGGGLTSEAQLFVTVTDVQDRPPYFTGGPYIPEIPEDHAVNSSVVTISALDGDRGNPNNITYRITADTCPGYFNINPTSGTIDLVKDADRDSGTVLQNNGICVINVQAVEVTSSGTFGATANDTVTVTIKDKNDNPPTFSSSHYEATIQENMPAGIPITFTTQAVHVEDLDQGDNAKLSLTLDSYSSTYFEIVPPTVQGSANLLIRVKDNTILDYEQRQSITLTVWANETSTGERNSASATIQLNITNQNDNSPNFNLSKYSASVQEGSRASTSVITVKAVDEDLPPFHAVSYALRGEDGMFVIDSSGLVTVASVKLDRETKSVYYISVESTDPGGLKDTAQLTVNITDANDNPPEFRRDYDGYLKENEHSFSRPITVSATDADVGANADVRYTITSTYPNGLDTNFSVDAVNGTLSVPGALDYETVNSSQVVVSVRATDRGTPPLYSDVNVTLTLQDENDNAPTFNQSSYGGRVHERASTDTSVVTVQATDADGSEPNNQVFYLIESGASDAFKIDGTSGEITVAGDLNREEAAKYTLLVKAMDRGSPVLSSFVNVTINILDVNDENPQFSHDVQFASVNETGRSEQLYTFSATDKDKNSRLSYNIDWTGSSGRDDQQNSVPISYLESVVNISQFSGEVITIGELDREKLTSMTLVVVVEDTNANTTCQTATGTLSITVLDINDNSPKFSDTTYSAEVLENMPEGTPITFTSPADMNVTDPDYETNSEFELTVDGHFAGVFTPVPTTVRSSSSVILRVQNSSWLDYEEHHNFTIKLIASETNTFLKRSSTATVSIQILDANDNSPTFTYTSYSGTIPENTNLSVTTVEATDPDSDRYAMGTYTLSGSENKFSIDNSTGEVKGVAGLDREVKSQYFMTVTAEDKGGRKQTVPLTVTVLDVNDNKPIFRINEYIGNIKENQNNFSSEVRVSATDADKQSSVNSRITFSLDQSEQLANNFSINGSSGVISPVGQLDYERLPPSLHGSIVLTVIATDGGSPSLSSNATLQINVQDINDNTPFFTNEPYTASIPENATAGTFVVTVSATDQDGENPNNQVMFAIDSGGSDFRVDARTGRITVQTGAALDREQQAIYSLAIVIIDQGTPPLSSNTTVVVNITDVNDEPPTFELDSNSASFKENSSGICDYTFNATDEDEISRLNYTIIWDRSNAYDERGGNINISLVKDWFYVNATTGDLCSLPSVIDRETAESITINVQVRDLEAEENIDEQTDTASVSVTIVDVNDNYPEIVQGSNIAVNVSEGTPIGTVIQTLDAIDRDLRQTVTFSTNSVDFNITEKGRISLAKKLDRETATTVNFTIYATDSGTPPLTSTSTINIVVLDTNDNDPQFSMSTLTFNVSEGSSNGTVVAKVTATDKDEGHNANVTFLLGDDKGGLFNMNSITGDIILEESLDRETVSTYSLIVTARDNPVFETPRLKRTTITIIVTDVNDNRPQFDADYTHTISETFQQGGTLLTVHATDKDIGNNGKVWYSLQDESVNSSGIFAINATTGAIKAAKDLLGLADTYTLTVVATDEGEGNLTGNATVTVTVLDENLNKPVFVNVGDIHPIPECSRPGSQIFQFSATDADRDKVRNGRVEFNMTDDTPDTTKQHFRLDKSTGALTVNKALDSEEQSTFTLKVLAYDLGIPSLSTISRQYTIKLKDINDNPPKFNQSDTRQKQFSVSENVLKTSLGPIRADDPDKDSQICYHISDSMYVVNLKMRPFTDNRTLYLDVVQPFDRENVTSFTVKITATDCSPAFYSQLCDNSSSTPSTIEQSSLITTITILDVNDNPPVYRQPDLSKGIRNTVTLGRIIFELDTFVYDRDSPKFSRHTFYSVNTTEADPTLMTTFNPEKHPVPISLTANGTVATNMSFSANMYGYFNMKVAVNDSAGMDMAELKIFIIADFQVLKITFLQSIDDVLLIQDDVLRDMSNATGYKFLTNDDVASHLDADGNIQPYHSDMFVHAVDPVTGKILDAENTRRIIDRNQVLGSKLISTYKVTQIGEADATVAKRDDSERRMYILIAIVCLLSFTLLLLIYISCNRVQRYKRKLKAATIEVKAPKSEEPEERGIVNINPLFNKDIAMQQEMDTTSVASGDSLDNNMVLDGNTVKEDDEQEFTVNFFDEKQQIRYGNNALGEVLRQYDFIDEEMGTRGHDMGDSASSSSEQGNPKANGKMMIRNQDLGDLNDLESTDI